MNPYRHREDFKMADILSHDWTAAYKAERVIKEELDNFER